MRFPTKDERTPFYFRQKGKPLEEGELQHRLYIDKPANDEVCEIGNIYRVDSNCLEIIDDSQDRLQIIGMGWILTTIFTTGTLLAFCKLVWDLITDSPERVALPGYWPFMLFSIPALLTIASYFGITSFDLMRRNLFSLKRRPMRLNRKTRRIYAIRTKGPDGIWEAPWSNDELFCIGVRKMGGLTRAYNMYDIRHYRLDENGNVVRAFVLGQLMFSLEQAQQQWEYYRRYMQDGPADLPEPHRFWAPHETFWEGFKICRGDKFSDLFESVSDYVFFPFMLLDATFRWLTLVTCSEPVWPPEIEAACRTEPNDPYARPYADDYIGFASGPNGQPSRNDIDRMLVLEKCRRREGALTRIEAEELIRKQEEARA